MKVCNHESENCSCPFAYTDASEQAQNYGCLPTPSEIIKMRQKSGKTWACHSDLSKPCIGAIEYMKNRNFEYKIIDKDLVTLDDDWSLFI